MELLNEIQVNKFGQNLVEINDLSNIFSLLTLNEKKEFLNDILFLIMQSKPKEEDIENAIKESNLKKTYTPCILLQKGVANHNLKKLLDLPENEINKSFILLLHLFKISYSRRFEIEKNDENKWWYWDLSDDKKVKAIIENRGIL
ncbi:DUF5958 family protein [Flavobacterium luteolum]|uniref:DUF5958 family protein n=1 Tax=Flavobacterium luteolum TaxID=3003259 RepID=UPI00248DE0D1|nr:DUF5958 family protein [Flavobacterium luteolum]